MQKIIDSLMYDTDKAKPVLDLGQHFQWEHAILYRTGGLRFFLSVKNYDGSIDIEPRSEDEAKKLVEQYALGTDLYISLWGEPEAA
jgi:hypothetical protein